MSVTVNDSNISTIYVRYDGRPHGFFATDLGNFSGTQDELFSAIESLLDFSAGALNGYELNITETEGATIRPQTKLE